MQTQALAQQLQSQGRGGDTILAHITPEEAQLLESRGGSGTTNPVTGLPEFGFFSDLWRGFKKAVKKIAPIIMPAIAIFAPALIPAVGTWLGASAALAPVVGAAALSAGVTLAAGGNLKEVLTSAALAGATTFITPIVGNAISSAVTKTTGFAISQGVSSAIGSAAVSGGIAAARGGSLKQVLAAAASGAASNYLTNLAQTTVSMLNSATASGDISQVNQKAFDDAVYLAADAANLKAAGLTEAQIASTLRATGVTQDVASTVANGVARGFTPETVAFNTAAANPTGIYLAGKSGATQSITAGNNLQVLQRAEDALMIATDAAGLKAQGLSTAQIKENLMATGVSETVAQSAANNAGRLDVNNLANTLQTSFATPGTNLYTTTESVVGRDLGKPMSTEQTAAWRAEPYSESIAAGKITLADASVLNANGYTPEQVASLTAAGYSGADLANMASVGIPASTLTTMANTKIPESAINNLFRDGASANDIAGVSRNLIDTGRLSVDSAVKILGRDFDANSITQMVNKGLNVDTVADSGLNQTTVNRLLSNGIDVNNVINAVQNGYTTADTVNQYGSQNNIRDLGIVAKAGVPTAAAPEKPIASDRPVINQLPVEPTPVAPPPLSGTTGTFGEEAAFLAYDAAQLRAQGLSTSQIKTTLLASGASEAGAVYASTYAGYGYSADQILNTLNQHHRDVDLYPTPASTAAAAANPAAPQATDPFADIKSTAVQLKGYGWTAEDLQNWMTSAGVPADQARSISGFTPAAPPTTVAGGTTTDPATGITYNADGSIADIGFNVRPGEGIDVAGGTGLPATPPPEGTRITDVYSRATWDETRGMFVDSSGRGRWVPAGNGYEYVPFGPAGDAGSGFGTGTDTTGTGTGGGTSGTGTGGTEAAPGTGTGTGTGAVAPEMSDTTYTPGTGGGTGTFTDPTDLGTITITPGATQPVAPPVATAPAAPAPAPYVPVMPIIPGGRTPAVITRPASTDEIADGTAQYDPEQERYVVPVTPTVPTTPTAPAVTTPATPTAPAVTTPATPGAPVINQLPVPPPPATTTITVPAGGDQIADGTARYDPEQDRYVVDQVVPTVPTAPVVPGTPTAPGTITQEMIDAANNTADPVGTLNNIINSGGAGGGTTTGTPTTDTAGTPGAGTGTTTTPGTGTTTAPGTGTVAGPGTTTVPGTGTVAGPVLPGSGTGTQPGTVTDGTGTTPGAVAGPGTDGTGVVAGPGTGGTGDGTGGTGPGGTGTEPGTGTVVGPTAPVVPPVTETPQEPPAVYEPVEQPIIPPEQPYVPVTPIIPEEPGGPGLQPFTPLPFKQLPDLALPGLNPGWIAPAPYYQTTSPVQSKFYYGARPYQPGPTFNQALYDTVPAPQQPWGLQQLYTPTNINQYFAQQAAGPVAPR